MYQTYFIEAPISDEFNIIGLISKLIETSFRPVPMS